jgi:hypothetical protein
MLYRDVIQSEVQIHSPALYGELFLYWKNDIFSRDLTGGAKEDNPVCKSGKEENTLEWIRRERE